MDFQLALLINIFHLKEWVICWLDENNKNDIIEKLNESLQKQKWNGIIRDICNGSKHFYLEKPSVSEYFSIIREYHPDGNELVNLIDGKQIGLSVLSESAIHFWYNFLIKNNLHRFENELCMDKPFSSSEKIKKKAVDPTPFDDLWRFIPLYIELPWPPISSNE